MTIQAYLTFNGNCEEAMGFYKDVLNGEFTTMMRFSEAPPGAFSVPEEYQNQVMHCTLEAQGAVLMASDTMEPDKLNVGSHCSLSIGVKTEDEGAAIFNQLSEGGHVAMPFEDAFWGGKFGMLVDRYGIQWMVSSEHKPE